MPREKDFENAKVLAIRFNLFCQLVRREIVGRYEGSFFGVIWSLITPALLLTVYTFVFTVVFKARWAVAQQTTPQFASMLFVGMVVHGFYADVLIRAPTIIIGNPTYVKKLVFPLEVLPLVLVGASLFTAMVNTAVLICAIVATGGGLSVTATAFPVVLLPLAILTTGLAWVLAALGVYVRDIGHTISIAMTVSMFLSPVFYPAESLPEPYRTWLLFNPVTAIIEQARCVLMLNQWPNWGVLAVYLLAALAAAWAGHQVFQKTRKGFPDVL